MNGQLRLLALPIVAWGLSASAQTVFTPTNAVPAYGTYDYAWYSELADPASPIDTNATTGIWDFSATTIADAFYYQVTISPASATPFVASSGGADVCWTYNYSWGNDYWYYKNGPDSLTWTASLTEIFDDDVYIGETCRSVQFSYPAVIGDVWIEDVTDCEGPLNGYPKNWRRKVIATGTLITSLGTYMDVVLVKDRLSAWNEAGVPPFPIYSEAFLWYLPNNALEPVAIWRENQDLNYLYMRILTPTTGLTESARSSGLAVMPNPATDRITLQSRDGHALGEVSIHAVDGRTVRQLGRITTDRLELDVQLLPEGAYAVTSTTNTTRSTIRFIKH